MSFTQVHTLSEVQEITPTYLAVGSFDGVHRGHQVLLQRMVAAARADGARAAVLTFFPHPKRVLKNLRGRYYITSLEDRVALLAAQGINLVITHAFNDEVRRTRAADFMAQLRHSLDMRQLWGGNFALGYQREGDVPFLRRLGEEMGYSVQLVEAMVEEGEELVSSSRVRRCLSAGDIAQLNGCLGRPYHLTGTVVKGDQRGRTIGFPTANLQLWEELILPANGVYATYAWVRERRFLAATNVGVRPTVDGREVMVEAHLLDFDGDLYGETLRLEFVARIRSEKKFSDLDALQAQIQADVAEIKQRLS
ncbi:MAG: bifunctional riboflavin kinase/FAD synthetase [Anaerolineae bacterium]